MLQSSPRAHRARLDDNSGISLIEMLVAIVIVGAISAVLVQGLISFLRGTSANEQRVNATAAAQAFVEELFAIDWSTAELYEAEVAADNVGVIDHDGDGTDDTNLRWGSRVREATVDGDTTYWYDNETPLDTSDDLQLVVRPDYAAADGRNPRVPYPVASVQAGSASNPVTYNVDRYIVAVDRDGDGTVETKRFVALVSWVDRFGNDHELSFESERQATSADLDEGTVDYRITLLATNPTTIQLDDDGTMSDAANLRVNTNEPTDHVDLQYTAVTDAVWNPLTGELVSYNTEQRTVTLTIANHGSDVFANGGHMQFDINLRDDPALAGELFANGDMTIAAEAFTPGIIPSTDDDTVTVTFSGGPFGEDPGDDGVQGAAIKSINPEIPLAACSSTKELMNPRPTYLIKTHGVPAPAAGTTSDLDFTYQYWTNAKGDNSTKVAFATITAQWVESQGNNEYGQIINLWRATIVGSQNQSGKASEFFYPGLSDQLTASHPDVVQDRDLVVTVSAGGC